MELRRIEDAIVTCKRIFHTLYTLKVLLNVRRAPRDSIFALYAIEMKLPNHDRFPSTFRILKRSLRKHTFTASQLMNCSPDFINDFRVGLEPVTATHDDVRLSRV